MAKKRSNAALPSPTPSTSSLTTAIAPSSSTPPPGPPPAILVEPEPVVKINKLNLTEVKGAFDDAVKKVSPHSSQGVKDEEEQQEGGGTSSSSPLHPRWHLLDSFSHALTRSCSHLDADAHVATSVVHAIASPSGCQARAGMDELPHRPRHGRVEYESRVGGEQGAVEGRGSTVSQRCFSIYWPHAVHCRRRDGREDERGKQPLELTLSSLSLLSLPATSFSRQSSGSTPATSRRTAFLSVGGRLSSMAGSVLALLQSCTPGRANSRVPLLLPSSLLLVLTPRPPD